MALGGQETLVMKSIIGVLCRLCRLFLVLNPYVKVFVITIAYPRKIYLAVFAKVIKISVNVRRIDYV